MKNPSRNLTTLRTALRSIAAIAAIASTSALLPSTAGAQDFNAMMAAAQAQERALAAQMQSMQNNIVQQNMQNPAVQQAYQQHVARARANGLQPWNFATFAYNYAYTGGFSSGGTQAAMRNEAQINAVQQQAMANLRAAEENRRNAQQGLFNSQARIAYERGNLLMGNSTFVAPNGYSSVLPHTWQRNTYNTLNGNTYFVDGGGRYYAYSNGSWIPLSQR